MDIQTLTKQITEAFADVKLADGISLREAHALDKQALPSRRSQARSKDQLESWQTIPDKDLETYASDFSFLDAKGVLYYLPAFMLYSLRDRPRSPPSSLVEGIIYALTPVEREDAWFVQRFALLNSAQQRAVHSFLNWKLNHAEDIGEALEISNALEYWESVVETQTD